MKILLVLCAFLVAGALAASGDEMKDKRGLVGFGYGLAPYSGYPGGAGFVHGYHGFGYRGFGGGYPFADGYHHHPYAYTPGAVAYHGAHGAHFGGYGGPFFH